MYLAVSTPGTQLFLKKAEEHEDVMLRATPLPESPQSWQVALDGSKVMLYFRNLKRVLVLSIPELSEVHSGYCNTGDDWTVTPWLSQNASQLLVHKGVNASDFQLIELRTGEVNADVLPSSSYQSPMLTNPYQIDISALHQFLELRARRVSSKSVGVSRLQKKRYFEDAMLWAQNGFTSSGEVFMLNTVDLLDTTKRIQFIHLLDKTPYFLKSKDGIEFTDWHFSRDRRTIMGIVEQHSLVVWKLPPNPFR